MIKNRLQRIKDFEEFYNNSLSFFSEIKSRDTRIKDFQENYKLSIRPGSRMGASDKRVVEVFWGIRKFETISAGHKWQALIEYGATLYFERLDSGYATILLYPAYTNNRRPIEDCIILERRLDPKKLKDSKFLKRQWNIFIAYMEVTSLDGNPNLIQKLQIAFLRFVKHVISDKKTVPRKINTFLEGVMKFTLTVGFSGFIIYMVTLINENHKNKEDNAQSIMLNKAVNGIGDKFDTLLNIQSSIKFLPSVADSIHDKTNKIYKILKGEPKP